MSEIRSVNLPRPPKILVVEDESEMAGLLEQALRESGYLVTVATNGQEGLDRCGSQDLLIVDVMMPVSNGFELVENVRAQGVSTPVLFLTARDGVEDRVNGLDVGGDDYLVKPFKLKELLARIRALLRRARLAQTVLEFDDLWLDTRSRKVKRGENWIHLSATEFAILELFMLQPKVTISRQVILREVWNELQPREGNVVEVYLNYLRSKLEAMGRSRLIHTVRGRGYILQRAET